MPFVNDFEECYALASHDCGSGYKPNITQSKFCFAETEEIDILYPRGCYTLCYEEEDCSWEDLFFNNGTEGSRNKKARQICKNGRQKKLIYLHFVVPIALL